MTKLRIALLLAIAVTTTGDRAWSEVTDEAGPSARNGRLLNLEELREFTASLATYNLVDVATRQQGRVTFGQKAIFVSWYFAAESDRAYLTRRGISCIVVRGDQQLTKCLTISEDRHSGNCRYLLQEPRDKRAACLREAP
jgi:hypothetical protein